MTTGTRTRIAFNPFYVLGVSPETPRDEVEREGQKLLGMLELGLSGAHRFQTPFGTRDRTPEMVREAMAELRDPQKRLLHELWAQLDPELEIAAVETSDGGDPEGGGAGPREVAGEREAELGGDEAADERPGPWPEARAALGWRRR